MAITFGTVGTSEGNLSGYTVPASTTMLLVALARDSSTDVDPVVAWNTSESLTQFAEVHTTARWVWVGYILNPTATTADITVGGSIGTFGLVAVPILGSTGAPDGLQTFENASASGPQSVTVTSEVNDVVISVINANNNVAADLVAGGTELGVEEVGGADTCLGVAWEAGAASVSADWNFAGTVAVAILGFNINADGGGAAAVYPSFIVNNLRPNAFAPGFGR